MELEKLRQALSNLKNLLEQNKTGAEPAKEIEKAIQGLDSNQIPSLEFAWGFLDVSDKSEELLRAYPRCILELVKAGADVNEVDDNGDSVLLAVANWFENVLECRNAAIQKMYTEAFCALVYKIKETDGNVDPPPEESVTALVSMTIDFDNMSEYLTPEAIRAFSKCVSALMDAGAEIREPDIIGEPTVLSSLCFAFGDCVRNGDAPSIQMYSEILCEAARKTQNADSIAKAQEELISKAQEAFAEEDGGIFLCSNSLYRGGVQKQMENRSAAKKAFSRCMMALKNASRRELNMEQVALIADIFRDC